MPDTVIETTNERGYPLLKVFVMEWKGDNIYQKISAKAAVAIVENFEAIKSFAEKHDIAMRYKKQGAGHE